MCMACVPRARLSTWIRKTHTITRSAPLDRLLSLSLSNVQVKLIVLKTYRGNRCIHFQITAQQDRAPARTYSYTGHDRKNTYVRGVRVGDRGMWLWGWELMCLYTTTPVGKETGIRRVNWGTGRPAMQLQVW